MPAPYDYSSTTGYLRARADWTDFPSTTTPITQTQLDQWDQALFDKKNEVVNVKDFGAKGDNSTVDSTAFQNALNAVSTGATVLVPAGTYIVNALTIKSGTRLMGMGHGSTMLKLQASSTDFGSAPNSTHNAIMRNANANTTGDTDIVIQDICFDGNPTNSNRADEFYFGLEMFGVRTSMFRNLKFQNWRGDGMVLDVNTAGTIVQNEDNQIRDIILSSTGFLNGGAGNTRQGLTLASGQRNTFWGINANSVAGAIIDCEPYNTNHILRNNVFGCISGYDVTVGVNLLGTSAAAGNTTDNVLHPITLKDGPNTALTYGFHCDNDDRTLIGGVTCDTGITNPGMWKTPSLLNSWVAEDATNHPIGYYRDLNDVVHLRGLIKSGTTTAGTVMFNLPSPYRPEKESFFATASNALFGYFRISAAGDVGFYAGSNTWFSFDGISFRAL